MDICDRRLAVKKLLESFMKKSYKRQIKHSLELKKVTNKVDRLCLKGKSYENSFNSWEDKKRYHYMKMSYYSKLGNYGSSKLKV